MQSPILSAALYLFASALLGLGVGWIGEAAHGWAVFAVALLVQLAYHLRHYYLLEAWSRDPRPEHELGGFGIWYEPYSRLFRHERELRREIADLNGRLARFGAAGQALSDGVVALDLAGHIEWCNDAAEHFLGLDRRTDIGEPITHLVRQPSFVAYLNGGDFSTPLRLHSERGGDSWLAIRVAAYGPDRRLLQVRDISQSERLDQMRRDFVANVSHELRTPLTVLAGFLETMREIELPPADRDHYLGLMTEQSQRMLLIIQDLLTLSSLEAAPLPSSDEQIDVACLIDRLARDAAALSGGQHRIHVDIERGGALLGADTEIASALGNLVSNAVRYTPPGGDIRISWKSGPNGGEFAVEDTGIGIDPEHIPRLTERFYRVDRSRSRETGGTGLGLAIVKHALNRHQASLHISSVPGKGSRFAVRFPASRVVGEAAIGSAATG